jgi:hypothetical protein
MASKLAIQTGDIVVCVDDRDGTQAPVRAYTKVITKGKKKGKTIKVPALLVKGRRYKVAGVTRPPHDHPDRPLVQVELPSPHEDSWWAARRFQKKGK